MDELTKQRLAALWRQSFAMIASSDTPSRAAHPRATDGAGMADHIWSGRRSGRDSTDACASVRRVKLSRNALALAVALVVNVLLVILLTPLGFESRPATDLKTVGYIAIGTIFTGLALDLASIVLLLFRRVRLASGLAIVGSILFFFPIFGDRIGAFFSVPIPPVINFLEYVFFVVLLVTLFLAWKVYRERNPSPI